jgi:DNA-binding transcriptional LysR family regulator
MDRYVAMQCYCRVVEAGSLAGAAKQLGLSNAVVTKYVKFLEAWTQARLLARTSRSLQVTPAGRSFYDYCTRVLADTEATLASVRGAEGALAGRLVVAMPVSLSLAYLHDHVHAFQRRHPAIELEVRLDDRDTDLVREGVDVALRAHASLEDSSLVAVPLVTFDRVVCAAPDYWHRHGKPAAPADLERMNCLVYVLGRDAGTWRFDGPDGPAVVRVRGTFAANNSLLIVDALRRGLGVGLVPRVIVEADLADGTLEPALAGYATESRTLHAVYPSRRHVPERARAFVEFLRGRLRRPALAAA